MDLCEIIRSIPTLKATTLALLAETRGDSGCALASRARRLWCTVFSAPLSALDLVDASRR